MKEIVWTTKAKKGYLYWKSKNIKVLKRINNIVMDIQKNPFVGIGKPEPLRHKLSGKWSRRIDDANRIVYCVEEEKIIILQCRYHYS